MPLRGGSVVGCLDGERPELFKVVLSVAQSIVRPVKTTTEMLQALDDAPPLGRQTLWGWAGQRGSVISTAC